MKKKIIDIHTNEPVFISDTQGPQVFYFREAHWAPTQTTSRWAKGLGEFRGKVRPILSLRPRKEHRAGEPRLCGAGQDVLQEMTQLVFGDIKVRIQPYKTGSGDRR